MERKISAGVTPALQDLYVALNKRRRQGLGEILQ
jgi:hypothetical protein